MDAILDTSLSGLDRASALMLDVFRYFLLLSCQRRPEFHLSNWAWLCAVVYLATRESCSGTWVAAFAQ